LHANRQRLQIHMALMMLILGMGLGFRSLSWELEEPVYLSTAYLFFSLFPLFFTLFVESLTRRYVSSTFKAALTLSLLFFVCTCWVLPIRHHVAWKLSFMTYHVVTLVFLLIALWRVRKASVIRRQERHVYSAIFYCLVLGLALMICEWLYAIGPLQGAHVRLSAFALLVFINTVVNIYFNENEFSFTAQLRLLVTFFMFSCVAGGILYLGGTAIITDSQYYLTFGLLFACALSFSSVYAQIFITSRHGLSDRITQLVEISKASAPQFLKDLTVIPEFRRVKLVQAAEVTELECGEVYFSLKPGVVHNRQSVKMQLRKINLSFEERNSLEAIDYLLRAKGAEAISAVGATGHLLLANAVPMRSVEQLNSILIWACENLRSIFAKKEGSPETLPLRLEWVSLDDAIDEEVDQ
jgi:hypothetical protein